MNLTKSDIWDGGEARGLRCSSSGVAASQYHDPAQHHMEKTGRSVESLLPPKLGLSGVIIPRATPFGGSRGFDANKPRLVNIDPDIKGQSCVIDVSKITKESMNRAIDMALENPYAQSDRAILAAQTMHNLAVAFDPVGIPQSTTKREETLPTSLNGYVTPKALPGGGQATRELKVKAAPPNSFISPSITPRTTLPTIREICETPDSLAIRASLGENSYSLPAQTIPTNHIATTLTTGFSDQTPTRTITVPAASFIPAPPPLTKVVFETEGWGQFTAAYHSVIRNGALLVLAYATGFDGGMKFFPPDTGQKLMAVRIDGTDKVYYVHSTGSSFEHAGYDYCILVIDSAATTGE